MHLTDLSSRKTYFPIVVPCLDALGRLGGGGKIIRIDVRRVFSSHIDEKSGKPPKSFVDFLTLVIRHRFFFFVPETPNPFFFGNLKRRAPEFGSKSAPSKVDLEPYGAIRCQIGSQLLTPKT